MPMLRPRDFEDLVARTGLELQVDADRTQLGPHGALDRKGRPCLLFFVPKPPAYEALLQRFTRVANAAKRIGAEVAVPEVVHVLDDWLVFVERASGEELCLGDWLVLRPALARRRQVALQLRKAVSALHSQRLAHGSLSPKHVLVGQGAEVVLTGVSLHALVDDEHAGLARDADGAALSELLRSLVGNEAEEFTDGAFAPPSLAVTGTLTIETPRPLPAAGEGVSDRAPSAAFERLPKARSRVAALVGLAVLVVAVGAGRFRWSQEAARVPGEDAPHPAPVMPSAVPRADLAPSASEPTAEPMKRLLQDASIAPQAVDAAAPVPPRPKGGLLRRAAAPPADLLEDALSSAPR